MNKNDWYKLMTVGMLAAVLWKLDDIKKEIVHFEKMHSYHHGGYYNRKEYERRRKESYK